jgi:uncharacterized protein YndB with AHSA1/START domain
MTMGTLHSQGSQHTLRFERHFAHPPERVWQALTENDDLAHWFPARIDGERAAGARLRFVFPPEPGQVPADSEEEGDAMTGEMRVFDPPRLLEYTWGGEILRWQLESSGEGTLLVLSNTFEDVAKSARDAAGWHFCLANLGSLLDGAQPESFTMERHDAIFETYARSFGPEASAKRGPGE